MEGSVGFQFTEAARKPSRHGTKAVTADTPEGRVRTCRTAEGPLRAPGRGKRPGRWARRAHTHVQAGKRLSFVGDRWMFLFIREPNVHV